MKTNNLLKIIKMFLRPKSILGKIGLTIAAIVLFGFVFMQFIYNPFFEVYTGVTHGKLVFDSSKKLTDSQFEALANELTYESKKANSEAALEKENKIDEDEAAESEDDGFTRNVRRDMLMKTRSMNQKTEFKHIGYFRKAGIRQYEGPSTCLKCHETMKITKPDGSVQEIKTLDDVLGTVHYKFQTMETGFSTYGYDGRKVNEGWHKIPVGKVDRACGIPGSFSWTGWASLIESYPEKKLTDSTGKETFHGKELVWRSEGCGQCHIGGNYHPATELMMPVGDVPGEVKEGVDCLICHSSSYDMNRKFIVKDAKGNRWNQDRSMRAALTVGKPKNENCLNCHQHNMGGDSYEHNTAAKSLGYKNQRLLHEGAKRGNAFSMENDVHYKAGILCTDCHVPQGHKIPRGTKGTDLVSNDLPRVEVACENCHTDAPHTKNKLFRVILNGHVNRLACETCHITHLQDKNVVLRDWVYPTYNKEEGIWTPTDIYRSGKAGKGFTYLWFNGNGTFLANALGSNPNKSVTYNPLMNQLVKITDPEIIAAVRAGATELKKNYPEIDIEQYVGFVTNTLSQLSPKMLEKRKKMVEEKIRPIMNMGKSKIYPFKMFNAQMFEDMSNQGPYGAMILPYDYSVYYKTGKTKDAVLKAISHPIVKRMYQTPFKLYMMDEFMYYFGVDGWKTEYPVKDGKLNNVEPHWMRQFGTLMVNHAITGEAFKCEDCHSPTGIMDFEALGYDKARIKDLQYLEELIKLPLKQAVKSNAKKKELTKK